MDVKIDYAARLARARAQMEQLGVELLYLPTSTNLEWLTSIPREMPFYTNAVYPGGWLNGAFVGLERGPVLAVPRMVADFDLGRLPGIDMRILPDRGDPRALAREVLSEFKLGGGSVAVEDRAWASATLNLQELLPGVRFTLASDVFRPLRLIKDETEIELMRGAGALVDQTMELVIKRVRVGVSELEVLTEINYQLARLGATAPSFTSALYTIHPGSAEQMVHVKGKTTEPLAPGIALPFDFGAVWRGYCSDFGRTVWIGEPPAEYIRTFDLVMEAQRAGAAALQAGKVTAAMADRAARQIIAQAGYGKGFRHRLGHGIGMDVHEPPFLNEGDDTVLQKGMCFTVEPSILVPDRWMVRVEDVFVVGEQGGEPLSHFTRELLVVA